MGRTTKIKNQKNQSRVVLCCVSIPPYGPTAPFRETASTEPEPESLNKIPLGTGTGTGPPAAKAQTPTKHHRPSHLP